MKLKKDFVLSRVADTWAVFPLSDATVDFNAMVKLNDSGALLWQALEKNPDKDALVATLMSEYDVSEQEATADVAAFLEVLLNAGCLEQD